MARSFLLRTLAILAALVIILQTLDLLGETGDILAAPGNGQAALWHYVVLRLPQIVARFLPFSVLLATLLTDAEADLQAALTLGGGPDPNPGPEEPNPGPEEPNPGPGRPKEP